MNFKLCHQSDCRLEEICVNNKCTVRKPYCDKDEDCPPLTRCEEKECIPVKFCKIGRDCDAGYYCRNGKCESSCEKVPVGLNSWFLIWP